LRCSFGKSTSAVRANYNDTYHYNIGFTTSCTGLNVDF
jgi:hypothetical protein